MYGSGLSEKKAEIELWIAFRSALIVAGSRDSGLVTTTPVLDTHSIVKEEAFIEENEL